MSTIAAMAKARALSARVTRPAPSAQLRHADLAERRAWSRSVASRMAAAKGTSIRVKAEGEGAREALLRNERERFLREARAASPRQPTTH